MLKKPSKVLNQVFVLALCCFIVSAEVSFANEEAQSSSAQSSALSEEVAQSPVVNESVEVKNFRADFQFPLEGPKSNVFVKSFSPVEKEKSEEDKKENPSDDKNKSRDGEKTRGEDRGRDNERRDDKGRDGERKDEENKSSTNARETFFEYALKTPYFFTENQELMLDVVELADLYEPNLLVSLKDDILTMRYTVLNKNITPKQVPAVDESEASAEKTEAEKKDSNNKDTATSLADEAKMKDIVEVEFKKELFVLVVDLDEDEKLGLLSHTVYAPVKVEGETENSVVVPVFDKVDEAKSYKDKSVTLNTPVEIIENFLFVPLSVMNFFNESVQKDATSYIASSNNADRANIKKLSQIKNETKEIEKAPEFLSRENFELIYAMIGPAGATILVLVLVATYLALKNFYYLTFVWMQFTRRFKKLDNECELLDEEIKTKNPMIHLLREIDALDIKDPTTLRTEISFIFNRNFESVVQDLAYIRLISVISPLLGLLGTVLGMVDVFQAIAESASPDPADLAQGIWSALLTTILGLSVAVPTLIIYYYLLLKYKRYQNRMIKFTNHFHSSCSGQ